MTNYQREIAAAAMTHNLDAKLVAAVVEQESAFRFHAYRYEPEFFVRYLANKPLYKDRDPREVSASFGLMQIMYTTAQEHGFSGEPWELFAPTVSLHYGCAHLASLMAWARAVYSGPAGAADIAVTRSALASYNGGKLKNSPNVAPLRNREYADQVLARRNRVTGHA